MPILVYRCNCGIEFSALLITQADRDDVCCPKCDSKKIEQIPATFSFNQRSKSSLEMFKRGPGHNPYENLTLEHVRDEHGKPIKVNSRKEMEAAEKKYKFVHHLSHAITPEQLDTPPLNETWAGDIRVSSGYEWKWERDPAKQNDTSGISVGVAATKEESLINA